MVRSHGDQSDSGQVVGCRVSRLFRKRDIFTVESEEPKAARSSVCIKHFQRWHTIEGDYLMAFGGHVRTIFGTVSHAAHGIR